MLEIMQSIVRATVQASQRLAGHATDSASSLQSHPYYPKELVLPGYTPPRLAFEYILTAFFAAAAAILCLAWVLSGRTTWRCWSCTFRQLID